MNTYKLIPLIIISIGFSQFYDVEVSIDAQKITENQKYILSNFNEEVENYFKLNNFCPEYDYFDIPLKFNLFMSLLIIMGITLL